MVQKDPLENCLTGRQLTDSVFNLFSGGWRVAIF